MRSTFAFSRVTHFIQTTAAPDAGRREKVSPSVLCTAGKEDIRRSPLSRIMAEKAEPKGGETVLQPRPTPRQSFSRFIMIFLGILALYVLIFPDVGHTFSLVAGAIMEPVIGFGAHAPVITILLAGLGTSTVSTRVRQFLASFLFPSWILLYSLLAIPFSQVVQRVLKYFTFRKRLQDLGEITEFTPPEEEAADGPVEEDLDDRGD